MKYYKIEVERTYTTEVVVKCKDEETLQNVIDANFTDKMLFDAHTNLTDYYFDEEMGQCNVTEEIITIEHEVKNHDDYLGYFDLDKYIIEDDA
tara:strand:- start:1048 stop:1326 length:279 start_codon:yes stop_codon:yes gene_type:complete